MPRARSTQLFLGEVAVAGPTVIYTVPAGYVVIVKQLLAWNTGGLATQVQYDYVDAGGGTGVVRAFASTVAAGAISRAAPYDVLDEGDAIQIGLTVAQPVRLLLTGSVLVA